MGLTATHIRTERWGGVREMCSDISVIADDYCRKRP
jgi:hypothetical protein